MNHRLVRISLVVALFWMTGINAQSKNDFRNVDWEMSEIQVKKLEKVKLEKFSDFLMGKTKVAGFNTSLNYKFSSDKLTGAFYKYEINHLVANQYIDDYEKIKKILISKYGEPFSDKPVWKSEVAKNALLDDGLAISLGQLEIKCTWINEKTTIIHSISGGDSKVTIMTIYLSNKTSNTISSDNSDSKDF